MADNRIETERLVLRRWRDADRDPFAAMNADPEVMRYFRSVHTREQSDTFIDTIESVFRSEGYGLFALEAKADGAFLGFTGFFPCPAGVPIEGEIEIGWRIARPFWRQGFAFEAASAALGWFWTALAARRVVSYTAARNEPSRALMRRLGLTHRPALDFDHPAFEDSHPLAPQTVYAMDRGEA